MSLGLAGWDGHRVNCAWQLFPWIFIEVEVITFCYSVIVKENAVTANENFLNWIMIFTWILRMWLTGSHTHTCYLPRKQTSTKNILCKRHFLPIHSLRLPGSHLYASQGICGCICMTVCVRMCVRQGLSGQRSRLFRRKGVDFTTGGRSGQCARLSLYLSLSHTNTYIFSLFLSLPLSLSHTHTPRQWPSAFDACRQAWPLAAPTDVRRTQSTGKGRTDEKRWRQRGDVQGRAEGGQADKVETEQKTGKQRLIMIDEKKEGENNWEDKVRRNLKKCISSVFKYTGKNQCQPPLSHIANA